MKHDRRIWAAAIVAAGRFLSPTGASAAFLAPSDWSTGWTRGVGTTTYQEWDKFTAAGGPNSPNAPGVPSGAQVSALPFNPNGTASTIETAVTTDGAFITSGGNIYSFGAATHLSTVVPDYNQPSSLTTVILQLSTQGSEPDYSSVKLNGTSPVYSGFLSRAVVPSPFGDSVDADTWFEFQLPTSGSSFTLNYNASGPSMSLDKVSVDSMTTPISTGYWAVAPQGTAVPEPASVGMVTIAAAGLLRRRRR